MSNDHLSPCITNVFGLACRINMMLSEEGCDHNGERTTTIIVEIWRTKTVIHCATAVFRPGAGHTTRIQQLPLRTKSTRYPTFTTIMLERINRNFCDGRLKSRMWKQNLLAFSEGSSPKCESSHSETSSLTSVDKTLNYQLLPLSWTTQRFVLSFSCSYVGSCSSWPVDGGIYMYMLIFVNPAWLLCLDGVTYVGPFPFIVLAHFLRHSLRAFCN